VTGFKLETVFKAVTTSAGHNGTINGEGQALLTIEDGESISWKGISLRKRIQSIEKVFF
jgi:hypothetical protein